MTSLKDLRYGRARGQPRQDSLASKWAPIQAYGLTESVMNMMKE
jgi:hypothetical protein